MRLIFLLTEMTGSGHVYTRRISWRSVIKRGCDITFEPGTAGAVGKVAGRFITYEQWLDRKTKERRQDGRILLAD